MMMIHAEVQVVIHKNGGFYRSRNAKKKSRVVVEQEYEDKQSLKSQKLCKKVNVLILFD
ncbi:hypothetical protein YC2023_060963 [Brassica napus]